jgi:hypothetical protein
LQVKRVRRTELGGCFKKYFRDDDGQENLINFDEEEVLEDTDVPIVEFAWSRRFVSGDECWNYQAVA